MKTRQYLKHPIYATFIILILLITGCAPAPTTTNTTVNLQRYHGQWYEIGSLPAFFQRNCTCTQAYYSAPTDGKITVINRCRKYNAQGELSLIKGKAWSNSANNSKLRVQFFWPFSGAYWILKLDKQYRYVLVGTPNRRYLWILSRTPTLPENTIKQLLNYAKKQGYDISKFNRTRQACGKLPIQL